MKPKCSSTLADILNLLSDGRVHTLNEIALFAEVSWHTAQRHVQSLSYRYPIETIRGGINGGGVILDTKYIVQGRVLTHDELQIIGKALELLQSSNSNNDVNTETLNDLIQRFTPPTNNRSAEYENQQNQTF